MLNNFSNYTPALAFWNCDKFPYFIPAIKGIETLTAADINLELRTRATSDVIVFVLSGTATYEVENRNLEHQTVYNVKPNDMLFFSCGLQCYTVKQTSADFKCIKFNFFLYTCHTASAQSSMLDFSEVLETTIKNQRMQLLLPAFLSLNPNDEICSQILNITEEYRSLKSGFTIQIQTGLMQLILNLLHQNKKSYSNILQNIDHIGITSKYNPYTNMPKGCRLLISDVEIYNSNPHSTNTNPKLLSIFEAHHNYKLNPKNDILKINNLTEQNIKSVELSAEDETIYHIWLNPHKETFLPDLRSYMNNGYLRFFAKCNVELYFGIVIYNHKIHQCINHTFHILPSDSFTEYCLPLLDDNTQNQLSPHIYKVIDYITKNYEQKIRLEDIAAQIHLNVSYISTIFKEQLGVSISDYVLDYRLTLAKNMLTDSNDNPISEIALSVGFYDTAHFTKSFKKAFGITPREYRNLKASEHKI